MQYGKIDAALAATLADAPIAKLPVFISFRDERTAAAEEVLARYGLRVAPDQRIVAAELGVDALDALSELACVRSIKLSGRSGLAASG